MERLEAHPTFTHHYHIVYQARERVCCWTKSLLRLSFFTQIHSHMGDWLRDLQNVSWVKATSFVFSSTHTPDVDLGSDQTCCRVPGVTSLAKTFLSNLTDPLTSHGNDAKKEQWREKRDGRG